MTEQSGLNSNISKRVVKFKKLQRLGQSLVVLISRDWLRSLEWDQTTELVVELLPYRNQIVVTKAKEGEMPKKIDAEEIII